MKTNTVKREEMARRAFAGGDPVLMGEVLFRLGYGYGGVWYPANGCTLAECVRVVVADMTERELEQVAALA